MTDCAVVLPFIEKYVKEVYDHLNQLNCQMCLTNLLYKWFISLFMENMNSELWLPIWDLMMLEGNIIVIKAAIIIILLSKDEILRKKESGDLYIFFEEQISHFKNPKFLEVLIKRKFNLNTEYLNVSRTKNLPKIIASITRSTDKTKEDESESCNYEWPLCLSSFSKVNIPKVSVLRELNPVRIHNDFYNIKDNVYSNIRNYRKKQQMKEEKDLEILKKKSNDSDAADLLGEFLKDKTKHGIYKKMLIYRAIHTCGVEPIEEEEESDEQSVHSHSTSKSGKSKIDLSKTMVRLGSLLEEKKEIDHFKIIDEIEKANFEENKTNVLLNSSLFLNEEEQDKKEEEEDPKGQFK